MKVILLLIKKSVTSFSIAVMASIFSGAAYTFTIIEIKNAIDVGNAVDITFLYKVIGLILVSSASAMISSYKLARLSERTAHELRLDLSARLLKSDFQGVENNSLKIIPVLTQDIRIVGDFIQKMPDLLTALAKALGCTIYLFWLSWELTLFVTGAFAIIFAIIMVILPQFQKHENAFRALRNDVFEHLKGLVDGLKELTLNKRHQKIYVRDVIGPASLQQSTHQIWINVLNTLSTKIGEVVFISLVAGMLVFLSNTNFLSTQLFVEYLFLLLFVLPSLIIIVTFFRNLKKVEASLAQIDALGIQMREAIEDNDEILEIDKSKYLISLDQVEYQYFDQNKRSFNLGPINLNIKENELLFIIGGNGSGKTSLAKLLTGLYQPSSGSIYFGSKEIDNNNLKSFRDQFTALFADSYVFPDLNYLDENKIAKEGGEIIEKLNISDKVSIEDMKLSQTNLSMGQRGRLSMLRALLEDKRIFLFDEWAANQDPFFKAKFYREILPDLKERGKTVIAITHDETYFDIADRVIKLDYGVIKDF